MLFVANFRYVDRKRKILKKIIKFQIETRHAVFALERIGMSYLMRFNVANNPSE
jgi:hypothetical protein